MGFSNTKEEALTTPHSRRLQLRSAGFRGPALPARKISPLAAQFLGKSGSPLWPINENSPFDFEKRVPTKEGSPPSPVNVLQEIHNSARRKGDSPKPRIRSIFQDCSLQTVAKSPTSWYNDNLDSPSPNDMATTVVRTRSRMQATPPPLSSSLAKNINGRHTNELHTVLASSEELKYIEHLENKLATAQGKLEAQNSPTTNKMRAAKLRTLTNENRSLRLDLRDWELKFTARVREEINERTEVENGLKARLQALEDEIEAKEISAVNMERELDSLRLRLKDMESLEATNVALEKRIDVLAGLLVRSPSKAEHGSTAQSPAGEHPAHRVSRRTSIIPRLPTSPSIGRSSSKLDTGLPFFPAKSPAPSPGGSDDAEGDQSMHSIDEILGSPGGIPIKCHARSSDTNSRASCPYQSLPSSSTRPTSVQSNMSHMTNTWGFPVASAPDGNPKPKQRQMRRFLSGAGSLKPLVLPATAIAPSPPSSPLDRSPSRELTQDLSQPSGEPLYMSPPTEPARYFSQMSVDPTTAFLSDQLPSSPLSMQSSQHCPRNSLIAHEEALQALEGRIRRLERGSSSADNSDEEIGLGIATASPDDRTPQARRTHRSRPRSLQEELDNLSMDVGQSSTDGLIAIDAEEIDIQSECIPIGIDDVLASPFVSPNTTSFSECTKSPIMLETTPKPVRLVGISSYDRTKPISLSTSLPVNPAHSLFNRLATLISSTKQEPINLARRLLWNAWVLGAASFGGVGWWLLGLAFRPSPSERENQRITDSSITGDGPSTGNKRDWKNYSMQANRRYHERLPTDAGISPKDNCAQVVPPGKHVGLLDEPHVFPCNTCKEPSTRQSMRLWLRFSLTIILAVGVAIKHGPGMILDHPPTPLSPPPPYSSPIEPNHKTENKAKDEQHRPAGTFTKDPVELVDTGPPRAYDHIQFSEILTQRDFESQSPV